MVHQIHPDMDTGLICIFLTTKNTMKGNFMKKYALRLIAAAMVIISVSLSAQAGQEWIAYKPGIVKTAIANGQTALLFYKSAW